MNTAVCKCCFREMALEQFRTFTQDGVEFRKKRCRQCEAAEAGLRWHRNKNRPAPKTQEQVISEAFREWAWQDVRPLIPALGMPVVGMREAA